MTHPEWMGHVFDSLDRLQGEFRPAPQERIKKACEHWIGQELETRSKRRIFYAGNFEKINGVTSPGIMITLLEQEKPKIGLLQGLSTKQA